MSRNCFFVFFLALPCFFKAQDNAALQAKKQFVLFSVGYRMPVNKNPVINSGHGIYLEAGFNPMRFFSNTGVVGLYAGWGWRDHLWTTSFNPAFAHQYAGSIQPEKLNVHDSAIIHLSKELIGSKSGRSLPLPGCETNSFHTYTLYYGVLLQHPGMPVALKLYTGSTRSHFLGSGVLSSATAAYTIVQLRRRMYGTELLLRNPLQKVLPDKKLPAWVTKTAVSVYYEYNDLAAASLYFSDGDRQVLIPLKHFMKTSFFSIYKREQVFGCKLSYTIF